MKRIALSLALLVLTGCTSSETRYLHPKLTPVKPTLSAPVKCGKIKVTQTGDRVSLSKRDADCLNRQHKACAHDRRKLLIAQRANVAQMETVNRGN